MMKYRMMIVEDDTILRTGLRNNPAWEKMGVEIVAEAVNGLDALQKMDAFLPQIVLADIEMPIMDGLELSKSLQQLYPKVKCILLTAYDEREYLRKAISYRVDAYVMKNEGEDEIFRAVRKAAEALQMQSEEELIRKENEQIRRTAFFLDICCKEDDDGNAWEKALKCGIDPQCLRCRVISFHVESLKNLNEIQYLIQSRQWYHLLTQKIEALCIPSNIRLYFFQGNENLNAVVLEEKADQFPQAEQMLQDTVISMRREMQIPLTAGMGRWSENIEGLHHSYAEALKVNQLRDILARQYSKEQYPVLCYQPEMFAQDQPEELVRSVKAYIDAHYQQPELTLQDIAEHTHLSANYVSTLFKKYSGLNIVEYLTQTRIEQAARLLTFTNMKTYEIAEQVGYTNSQYFSVLFKRRYGLSPKEYRGNL